MRRLIPALLILAVGATLLTSAEPASAVSVVTGVNGTAAVEGPVSYSRMQCSDQGTGWSCTDWTDVNTSGKSWISMELSCFFICFGDVDLSIDDALGPPGLPQQSPYFYSEFFVGTANAVGNVVTVRGTAIDLGRGASVSQWLKVWNPTVTMNFATGEASITWPQSDERCDYYGVCWRFRAGPQASGTLVSGGLNVAGF